MPIFLLGILKSKWTWIIIALIAICSYGYSIYLENQELKLQQTISQQNFVALEDSLNKAKDSIQTMTVFIGDLNTKNDGLEEEKVNLDRKYRATRTKLEIAMDAIKKSGEAETNVHGDSVEVSFKGKEGIASYEGKTIMSLSTNASSYSIGIEFDDILATSEIFKDETDSLWKTRTVALTPGIKLRGITTIDTETLRKLSGIGSKEQERHYFGIGGNLNSNYLEAGIRIKPNRWMFEANYKIADKLKYEDESWMNALSVGVVYFLF